jgi:hypothetical protein
MTVLLLGATLALPAIAGAWKGAGLRGEMFAKWSSRVDVAHAGLNKLATSEVIALQDDLSNVFGGTNDATNRPPAAVSVPADRFIERTRRCTDLLRTRDRLRRRFARYCLLGRTPVPIVCAYGAGVLIGTLHYTMVIGGHWSKTLALGLGGTGTVCALLFFSLYAYYESRLSAAEVLAAGATG